MRIDAVHILIWLGLVCLEIAVSVEGVILVLPSSHTQRWERFMHVVSLAWTSIKVASRWSTHFISFRTYGEVQTFTWEAPPHQPYVVFSLGRSRSKKHLMMLRDSIFEASSALKPPLLPLLLFNQRLELLLLLLKLLGLSTSEFWTITLLLFPSLLEAVDEGHAFFETWKGFTQVGFLLVIQPIRHLNRFRT